MEQSLWCVLIEDYKVMKFVLIYLFEISDLDFETSVDANVFIILFQMASMHVNHAREIPEYEVDPKELDFTNSVEISKVSSLLGVYFHFDS